MSTNLIQILSHSHKRILQETLKLAHSPHLAHSYIGKVKHEKEA